MPDTRPLPYSDWNLDFLADYIINTHHSYVRQVLPELRSYATKVAQVHSDRHPELPAVLQLVEEVNAELTSHMVKEERVLFPYIKELVKNSGQPLQGASFGTVQN